MISIAIEIFRLQVTVSNTLFVIKNEECSMNLPADLIVIFEEHNQIRKFKVEFRNHDDDDEMNKTENSLKKIFETWSIFNLSDQRVRTLKIVK